MTEQEKTNKTLLYLNNTYKLNLEKTKGQFDLWDAQDNKRIIEFKFRSKYYQEKYIQLDKFLGLIMAAEYYNKIAFYIVHDELSKYGYGYYIYNLTELKEKLIESKIITKKVPYSTEFNKTKKINKYFYILNQSNQTNQL
tara:strand:+ start:443 stop:862 length:420 start_codon:yes stop_codon:yes gene_type:complete